MTQPAGAGLFPAGQAPAGYVPPSTPAPTSAPPSGALMPFFDLGTRQFVFAPDGSLELIHPVDHAVMLILGTTLGTITCAPDVGVDWSRIKSAKYGDVPKVAQGEIARALDPLITANDVELNGVDVQRPVPGRTQILVTYTNLRAPTRAPQTSPVVVP